MFCMDLAIKKSAIRIFKEHRGYSLDWIDLVQDEAKNPYLLHEAAKILAGTRVPLLFLAPPRKLAIPTEGHKEIDRSYPEKKKPTTKPRVFKRETLRLSAADRQTLGLKMQSGVYEGHRCPNKKMKGETYAQGTARAERIQALVEVEAILNDKYYRERNTK